MTRCGQGLLNSDVELDQVLARVLGDDMTAGYCLAARDDLFVGGDTIDEALANWKSVLTKIATSNLKVTAKKVRVFLGDTEVFGHRIRDGEVHPSDHNINSLAKTTTDQLKTVRQVNAWKGLYKTLIRHLPNLAQYMSPFDTACGGKDSSSQFDWTRPGLVEAFNAATNQLDKVHHTVLPAPSEQLYLMPDTSKSNLCSGWVLYTKRVSQDGDKLLPVQYASAKLPKYMANWCPCEMEGVGTVMAIDQVRHWINESHLTTIVLPDNKPVVDAANLLKIGKYSKNSRLQSLLTCVNRSNITFKHNSAKAGLHMVPDAASRLKTSCGSKDCQVERFLRELPDKVQCMSTTIGDVEECKDFFSELFVNIAAANSDLTNLLETSGPGPIPLGSRQAWMEVQQECEVCQRFLECKRLGQLPGRKDKDKAILNKMLKRCEVSKGLIVSKQFDDKIMKEVEKTFVPLIFLPSILTIMHIKLSHPPSTQLQKLFEKYFVAFNVQKACEDLSEQCNLCISLARFPKELVHYDPQLVPLHPGSHMNVDIIKRASQNILVNCDLFSGYVTASVVNSEQREDMVEGILALVTPVRHSDKIIIRVDRAPALKSLANNPDEELKSNGIEFDLGEHFNKNSNCSVDKKIQELEFEIRRLCPKETKLSSGLLSKAVTSLNNRIRNQGLSAAQIHFSRDTIAGHNLQLNDNKLMAEKLQKRRENHPVSLKSKSPSAKEHVGADVVPGQLVYVRDGLTKHEARDPLLVTGVEGSKVRVQKVLHSHDNSIKSPKITSEKITVDEKFLYVPPHRRSIKTTNYGSSNDSWWRRTPPTIPETITDWTPTHRQEDDDWYVQQIVQQHDYQHTELDVSAEPDENAELDANADISEIDVSEDSDASEKSDEDGGLGETGELDDIPILGGPDNFDENLDDNDRDELEMDHHPQEDVQPAQDDHHQLGIDDDHDLEVPAHDQEPHLDEVDPAPQQFGNHHDQPPEAVDDLLHHPPYIEPIRGDHIQYFDPKEDTWKEVIITHTSASCLRSHPGYYNFRVDARVAGSVHLTRDTLWRFSDQRRRQFYWWRWGHLYTVMEGND